MIEAAPIASQARAAPRRCRQGSAAAFALEVLWLAASLAFEGLTNLVQLVAYVPQRLAIRRAAARLILRQRRSLSILVALLALCLASAGAGCQALHREWTQLGWTLGALVDQSGELDGLARDLTNLCDPEADQFVETFVMLGF